jgi:hypothetical protein
VLTSEAVSMTDRQLNLDGCYTSRATRRSLEDGVTDSTLLVSGIECALASASVTGGGNRRRQRTARTRRPASASKTRRTATAMIGGSVIGLTVREPL